MNTLGKVGLGGLGALGLAGVGHGLYRGQQLSDRDAELSYLTNMGYPRGVTHQHPLAMGMATAGVAPMMAMNDMNEADDPRILALQDVSRPWDDDRLDDMYAEKTGAILKTADEAGRSHALAKLAPTRYSRALAGKVGRRVSERKLSPKRLAEFARGPNGEKKEIGDFYNAAIGNFKKHMKTRKTMEKTSVSREQMITGGLAGLGTMAGLSIMVGPSGRSQMASEVEDPQLYKNIGTQAGPALLAGAAAHHYSPKFKIPAAILAGLGAGKVGREANKALFLNDYRAERGMEPLDGWFTEKTSGMKMPGSPPSLGKLYGAKPPGGLAAPPVPHIPQPKDIGSTAAITSPDGIAKPTPSANPGALKPQPLPGMAKTSALSRWP